MEHRLDPSDHEAAIWNALAGLDIENRICDRCDYGHVETICSNCDGSGEGYADGTTCSVCHGRGERWAECGSACEYCGEHAALNEVGACDLCAAFLEETNDQSF